MAGMLENFNSTLIKIMKTKKPNSSFLTKEKYDDLLKKVSDSKNKTSGKKPEDYQRLKRYDVMKIGDIEKLIFPKSKDTQNVRFYVHFEELFSIIHETHLAINHGGRNKMIKELQKKYKNITTEEVMIYLNLCESCQKKSKVPNKGVIRPIVFHQMLNSRCQVDIIDMQSRPDNDFKFILIYQDCLTKFVQLRALKTKHAKEIAYHLINIYTAFGAPSVLQSNEGRDFSRGIVEEACSMWPDLKIVHGSPVLCQTQGSNEVSKQDIENILFSWLDGKCTSKWSDELCFVQLIKNRTFHDGLKCTPYEAMFGTPVKLGLKTSSFPNESIEHLRTEEDLKALMKAVNIASENIKNDPNNDENDEDDDDDNDEDNDDDDEGADNSLSQNNLQPQINFDIKKENEAEVPLLRTDTLNCHKQTRKRKMISKDVTLQAKKVLNNKFTSGELDDAIKSRASNFDTATDPRSLLEVILEV